ncbi:MAG TPA: HAD family hydrolase [Acidimicrobiales bacterium]|nr:HAD family hydrolase [Acidimicrobiales bacterium]
MGGLAPLALIFDLDDTLITEGDLAMQRLGATAALLTGPGGDSGPDPSVWGDIVLESARAQWRRSALFDTFKELGFASWEGLWSNGAGNHARLDGLAEWLPGYRERAWRLALETAGLNPAEWSRLAGAFTEAQRSGHPLLPGAAETVQAAAGRFRLGLLTNGPSDIQRLKLDQTGLAAHFGSVVISGELGQGKPDPAVFQAVMTELDVTPERTVMIGDSWERDVAGAAEAGLAGAIWVAAGREPPESPAPWVTVVPAVSAAAVLELRL